MEEKRFDPYQFIGFVLIALILTWMLYVNRPEETVISDAQPTNTETVTENQQLSPIQLNDSLKRINLQSTFGIFSNWMVEKDAKIQKIEKFHHFGLYLFTLLRCFKILMKLLKS